MKLLTIALLLVSFGALSNERNFIDLSIIKKGHLDGYSLTISKAIDDNVFLSWSTDQLIGEESISTYSAGLGVQFKSSDSSYIYGGIGYKKIDVNEGVEFKLGSTNKAFGAIDLTTEVKASMVNVDSYVYSYHEARYNISSFSSIGVGVELNHNSTEQEKTIRFSVRAGF